MREGRKKVIKDVLFRIVSLFCLLVVMRFLHEFLFPF